MIDIWYGDVQTFGTNGLCQRWVNVLGRLEAAAPGVSLYYELNGLPRRRVSLGPDGHRLARAGDFNVELPASDLRRGSNELALSVVGPEGEVCRRMVRLVLEAPRGGSPDLVVRWRDVSSIGQVAQVVDGRWALTPSGVRTLEPWYDRVIGIGDVSWRDCEVSTTVTFHGLHEPDAEAGDGGAGVIHAALALRWPGHDGDERQPHVKWWPLGATAEFQVNPQWRDCRWRILGGVTSKVESSHARAVELERPYAMQARVTTLPDGGARYSAALWPADDDRPGGWDVEMTKPAGDVPAGGALLIAHYTDATFGDVHVRPM